MNSPNIFGYSDLETILVKSQDKPLNLMVDTNILISSVYDSDKFYDETEKFLDSIADQDCALYCNVNIRSEFLEIQRRIIFTEGLLDFEANKPKDTPFQLKGMLSSLRSNQDKRDQNQKRSPLRLADPEIKKFKKEMSRIKYEGNDLWSQFCADKIGNKLQDSWVSIESKLDLNFISTTDPESQTLFITHPKWKGLVKIMESMGLASADAMVLNMFLCTKFEILLSSDFDVGLACAKINKPSKIVILPDSVKDEVLRYI
jgi:predicted nucleic acid-binding protein